MINRDKLPSIALAFNISELNARVSRQALEIITGITSSKAKNAIEGLMRSRWTNPAPNVNLR